MADIDELKKKLEDGWIKGEPYVFVSYASKDKEKVYEFVYELRKRGINVYILPGALPAHPGLLLYIQARLVH